MYIISSENDSMDNEQEETQGSQNSPEELPYREQSNDDADVTDIVQAVEEFNSTSTDETANKCGKPNAVEVVSNLDATAAGTANRVNEAAGGVMGRLGVTAIKGIIGKSVKDTVNITTYRIKEAIKAVLFRLIKIWLVWLVVSVLIGNTIGGGEAVFIIVLTFFLLAIYSVISTVLRLRMSAIHIATGIPSELVARISADLTRSFPQLVYENTGINVEMINGISNKINQILRNPLSLLYNPRQVVTLTQEIYSVVQNIIARAGAYLLN